MNMTDAARFASAIGAKYAVPLHWGLFDGLNGADFPFAKDEKNYWLDKYLPEIDQAHRIFTVVGRKKTDYIPGGVQPTDILLDDYNKNLEAWEAAGGIGIKLLNGLNTRKTWKGTCVRSNVTIKEIFETLLNADTNIEVA